MGISHTADLDNLLGPLLYRGEEGGAEPAPGHDGGGGEGRGEPAQLHPPGKITHLPNFPREK